MASDALEKYDQNQDRDELGRWTSGGGGLGRAGDYLGSGDPISAPETEGAAFATPQDYNLYRVRGEKVAGLITAEIQRGIGVEMGAGSVEQSDEVEPRGAKVEDGKLLLGVRTAQELAVARRNGRIDRDEQVDALRAAADAVANTQQFFTVESTEEDGRVNSGLNALLRDSVARSIAKALGADRESTRVLGHLEKPVVKLRADGKPEPARFARVRGSDGLVQVLWIAAGSPKGDDATVSAAILKQAAKIKSVAPHLRIQRIIEDGFAHAGIKRGSPDWEEKAARARERISARLRGESLGKACGSGELGAPGFQEGNSCGSGGGMSVVRSGGSITDADYNAVVGWEKLPSTVGGSSTARAMYGKGVLNQIRNKQADGVVSRDADGKIDGLAALARTSDDWIKGKHIELNAMATRPGTSGVGKKVLDRAIAIAGEANLPLVINSTEAAEPFYDKSGLKDYKRTVVKYGRTHHVYVVTPKAGIKKADGPETRQSCLQCVEKHLGAAMVLMGEVRDGYEYRLRVIGHMHEAEDESQEYDKLHDAIRDARKAWQEKGTVPDWDKLNGMVAEMSKGDVISGNLCRGESGQFTACGADAGPVIRTAGRASARIAASGSDIRKLKADVERVERETGGRSKAGEKFGEMVAAHGRAERALSSAVGALKDGRKDSAFRAWVQANKAEEALADAADAARVVKETGVEVGNLAENLEETRRFAERMADDAAALRDEAETRRKTTRYAKADFQFVGMHKGDGVYVVDGIPSGMSALLKDAVEKYGAEWAEAWEQDGVECVSFRIPGASAPEAVVQTFELSGMDKASARSVAFDAGTLLRRISSGSDGRGVPEGVVRAGRDAARSVLRAEEDANLLAQGHYLGILAGVMREVWKDALIPGTAEEAARIAAEAEKESVGLTEGAAAWDDLRMGKNCGTGPEGFQPGNTCARGDGSSQSEDVDDSISKEPTVKPSSGEERNQDPTEDKDGDGIADMARVGVAADEVPPPPKNIPRLPNLTKDEREVEEQFAQAFEKDPDGVAKQYADLVKAGKIGDGPNIFNTDDAKLLAPGYNPQGKSDDEVKEARSRYNAMVHQTANAVAKRAFLSRLDELGKLPEDDPRRTVLVTSGGVASGKGYALSKVASDLSAKVGAVWDAAGEQNATENPWIMKELEKRGLKGVFAFVHADPVGTWENPKRGVIERAGKKGRMVDGRVFADSYAYGAKNFKAFAEKNGKKAEIIYIDNSQDGKDPVRSASMPKAALEFDAEDLYARASKILDSKSDIKPAVRRGGSVGRRIWGAPKKRKAS